jgi:hypothetical protein
MLAQWLVASEYWLLWALAIATAGLALRCAADSRDAWRGLRATHWAALGALVLLGAGLRVTPERWQHNVFDDEYAHLRLAAKMSASQRFAFEGPSARGDWQVSLPPCPPAFHFLLANVFLVSGYAESSAFLVNALCGVLCVPAVFLLARLLFDDDWAAVVAAASLTVWPLHVKLSRGTSLEILALLALLVLGAALALAKRRPSAALLQLVALLAAWTALTRPELIVVLPLVLWLALADRRLRSLWATPWRLALALLPMSVPALHALFSVAHYNEQREMTQSMLLPALLYWIRPGLYCPLWTLAGLAGAVLLYRQGRRGLALLLSLGWLADVLIVSVYRRVDPNLGDLQRYFVIAGSLALLLTAYCLGRVRRSSRRWAGACVGLTLAGELLLLPKANEPISPIAELRLAQRRWLVEHVTLVPREALLFAESADFVWAVTGRLCLPARQLLTPDGLASLAAMNRPLVLVAESSPATGSETGTSLSSVRGTGDLGDVRTRLGATTIAEGTVLGRPIGLYRLR